MIHINKRPRADFGCGNWEPPDLPGDPTNPITVWHHCPRCPAVRLKWNASRLVWELYPPRSKHEEGAPPNPKDIVGKTKVPLRYIPPVAKAYLAMALADGAVKYGPFNWRRFPIEIMGYLEAAERHLDELKDGEDVARDSLLFHAAHIMACMAIVLDAHEQGTLIDNRPVSGKTTDVHERLVLSGPSRPHNAQGSALRTDWDLKKI